MNIEDLLKDLDPITIIEFKNYLNDNLSKLCSLKNSNSKVISKFKNKKDVVINADVYFIKVEKLNPVFKSIFAVVVSQLHLKLQIL